MKSGGGVAPLPTLAAPDAETRFPYVVVRWVPGVYGRYRVRFQPGAAPHIQGTEIVLPDSPAETERRAALLHFLLERTRATGRRMCAVFAAADSVFVEPDGSIKEGAVAPHGGVRLDNVAVPGDAAAPSKEGS